MGLKHKENYKYTPTESEIEYYYTHSGFDIENVSKTKLLKQISINNKNSKPQDIAGGKWERLTLMDENKAPINHSFVGDWAWKPNHINKPDIVNYSAKRGIYLTHPAGYKERTSIQQNTSTTPATVSTYNNQQIFSPLQINYKSLENNKNIAFGLPIDIDKSNVIINRPNTVVSYSNQTNSARYVAWKISKSDLGHVSRHNKDFVADYNLDVTGDSSPFKNILSASASYDYTEAYKGSGFDKGHIIPNADRNSNEKNQLETFVFSNALPQSPANNRGPWEKFEAFTREPVQSNDFDVYVVAGGIGTGGFGSNGYKEKVGNINVPMATFKVTLTVKKGGLPNNAKDIVSSAAIITPNINGIQQTDWKPYKTSIANVERLTGLTFFNKAKSLNKSENEGRSAISFTGKLDYKDMPVTYIPYLNDLRLINVNLNKTDNQKSLTSQDFRADLSNPNKIKFTSYGELGAYSDKEAQVERTYAILPFNPTKLSDSYYKDFNGYTLPQQHIYENIYRFTTGGSKIPDSVKRLDNEINYMGFGHKINRLLKRNIYETNLGPLGSLLSAIGKITDKVTGQDERIEEKHLLKQDRKGNLKKILGVSQYEAQDADTKGAFETAIMSSFNSLQGVALATVSYVTINKTFNHLTAGFETNFLNSLIQRSETSTVSLYRHLATSAFFGTNFAEAIREANTQSTNDIEYKENLSRNLRRYNPNNTVINSDGNLQRSNINQPAIIGLTSRMRKLDSTKLESLIKPIFEMINPYQFGTSHYNKFTSAIHNIVKVSGLTPAISFIKSGDLVSSKPIIKNIGTERIRVIAKSWDKLGMYLPANIAYWVPNLRESLNLPQFDPTKHLTIKDIVSFEDLTVYTQHYVDKFTSFIKHPLQELKKASGYLKDLGSLYSIETKLNKLEAKLNINPYVLDPTLSNALNAETRAIEIEARKAAGYVKGSNRISAFVQNNAEYFELLKQQNEITRRLNINEMINPSLDNKVPNLKTTEEAIKVTKSSKKFIFGLGIALLANKFLDDYLFSSPGASLPTQISAYFGLQTTNDINNPNNRDLTVARYKFTDVVPSQLMWGLAGTVGLISGKLFPDVKDITFRSGGVYDLLTQGTKTLLRQQYAVDRATLPNIENVELSEARLESNKRVSKYNLEVGKLKAADVRRLSNRFNVKVAGIATLSAVVIAKTLFSTTAGLLNLFTNQDEGVAYSDDKAMTIALLNRLTREALSKPSTGQNISEINSGIALSQLLSNTSTVANRTYNITTQTPTPFLQVALLSQIRNNQKLGGKDNDDKGITSFGVSLQLLPVSGLGFTIISPLGIRLKESTYKSAFSLRTTPKQLAEGTLDVVASSVYTAVNFLTLSQQPFQLGYVPGTGFDELLMSSGAVFATSAAFDHLHSFARPGLVRSYGESSKLVKEYDALMHHTKALRSITYGAYRFSDRALGFMASLPYNTIKATSKGIYSFFATNPDVNIVEEASGQVPSSNNLVKKNSISLNLLRAGLAYYLPIAVARVLTNPANGFVGQGFQDPNYQLAATLQVGLATGLLFQGSGIFASSEQLAADFRRAVQLKGTTVNQYQGARQANELNQTIDSIFDASMEYKGTTKGVRRFTPTGILFRLAKNTLYEQGAAIQAARNVDFQAPIRLPGSRFGGVPRFMYGAAILTGMVLASKLFTSMFTNDQDLDNFYRNNPFAPGIRLLAGVEPQRNNVDATGFDVGVTTKERVNGIGNFTTNLFKSLTFGLLDIGKLVGTYADTANPFFNAGPFGLSFKQKQTTGYIQFASSFSDLSVSAFDLTKSNASIEELVKTTRLFRNGTPRSLTLALARIRGATPRQKPMNITGISSYIMRATSSSNIIGELSRRQNLTQWLKWQRSSELMYDLDKELSPWTKGPGALSSNLLLAKAYGKYISDLPNPLAFLGAGTFEVSYPDVSSKQDTKVKSSLYTENQSVFNNVSVNINPLSLIKDISNFGIVGKTISVGLSAFALLGFVRGATDVVGALASFQAEKDAITLYKESRLNHLFNNKYEFGVSLEGEEKFFYQKRVGSNSVYRLPLDYEEYSASIGREAKVGGVAINSPSKLTSLTQSIASHHKSFINSLKNYFLIENTGSFSKSLDTYLDYALGSNTSDIVNRSKQFKNEIKSNVIKKITTSLDKRKLHVGSNINLFQALYQHSTPEGKSHFQDFMQVRVNPLLDEVVEGLAEHIATIQRSGELNKGTLRLHAYSFLQKNQSFNVLMNTLTQPLSAELPVNTSQSLNYDKLNKPQQELVDSIIEKPWSQTATSTVSKALHQTGSLIAKWSFQGKFMYELAESSTVLLSGTSDPSLRLSASRQFTTSSIFAAEAWGISKLVGLLGAKGAVLNTVISLGALFLTEKLKQSNTKIKSFESGVINSIAGAVNWITKPLSNLTKYVVDPTLDKLFRTVSAPFISDTLRNLGKETPMMQWAKAIFLPQTSYLAQYEYRLSQPRWGETSPSYVYGNSDMYLRQEYDAELQQSQSASNPIDKKLIHANLLGMSAGALDTIYEESIFKSYDGVSRASDEFSIGKTYKLSNLIQQELKRRQVLYDQLVMGSSISHPEWNHIHKDTFNSILSRYSFQHGGGLLKEAHKFIKLIGKGYNVISSKVASSTNAFASNKFPNASAKVAAVFNKENQTQFFKSIKDGYTNSRFNKGLQWIFNSETYKPALQGLANWMTSSLSPAKKEAIANVLKIEPLKHLDKKITSFSLNVTGSILGLLTSRVKLNQTKPQNLNSKSGRLLNTLIGLGKIITTPFRWAYSGLSALNKGYQNKLTRLLEEEALGIRKSTLQKIKDAFSSSKAGLLNDIKSIKGNAIVKRISNTLYEQSLTSKYYLNRLSRFGVLSKITNQGFLLFDAYTALNIDRGINKVNQGGQFRREYYSNYDAYGSSFGALTAVTAVKGLDLASKFNKIHKRFTNPLLSIGLIIGSAIVGGKLGDAYGEQRFKEDYYNKKKQDPYINQKDWLIAGALGTLFQLPSIVRKSFIRQEGGGFKFSKGAFGKNLLMHTGANIAFSVVGNTAFGYGALTNATILSYYDSFPGFGRGIAKTLGGRRTRSPLPDGYYPEPERVIDPPILKEPNVINGEPPPLSTSNNLKRMGDINIPKSNPPSSSNLKRMGSLDVDTPMPITTVPSTSFTDLNTVSAKTPKQYINQLLQNANDPAAKFVLSQNVPIGFESAYNFDGLYRKDLGFRFGRNILQTITGYLKGGNISGHSLAMSLDTIFHESLHVTHLNQSTAEVLEFQRQLTKSLLGKGDAKYNLGFDEAIPSNVRQGIMARARASTIAYAKRNLDAGTISHTDFKQVFEYEIQANTYAYRQVLALSKSQPQLNLDLTYYNQTSTSVNNPVVNQEFKQIKQHLMSEAKQSGGDINSLYNKKSFDIISDPWTFDKNQIIADPWLEDKSTLSNPNSINRKPPLLLAPVKNPLPISPKPGQSLYEYNETYKLNQRINKLPDNKFTQYFKGKIKNLLLNKIDKVYFEVPEISTARLGKYVTGTTSVLNLTTSGLLAAQYQKVTYETADQLTEQAALNTTMESTQQLSNIFTANFKYKLIAGFLSQAMVTGKVFGVGGFDMIKDPYHIVSNYQKQQKEQLRLGHAIYDPFGLGNSARLLQDTEVLHQTVNLWGQTKKLAQPMYDIFKDNKTVAGLSKKVSNSLFVNILSRLTRPIGNTITSFINKGLLIGEAAVRTVDKGVSFVGSLFGRAFRAAASLPVVGKVFSILNSNFIKYGLKKTSLDFIAPALDIFTSSTSAFSFINRQNGTQRDYEYDYAQFLTSTRSLEGSIIGRNSLGVAGDIVGALAFNFQAQSTVQQEIDYRLKAGDLYSTDSRAALVAETLHNTASRTLAYTYLAKAGVSGISKSYQAYQGYKTIQTLSNASRLGLDSRVAINVLKTNPGIIGKIRNAINIARASKAITVISNIAKAAQPIVSFTAPLLKAAAIGARVLDPVLSVGMIGYGHYKINKLTETSSQEAYKSAYTTTYKGYGALTGAVIGGALGSAGGPLGTALGSAVGSIAGGFIGGGIGGFIGSRTYNNKSNIDISSLSRNIGIGAIGGSLLGVAGAAGLVAAGIIAAPIALPALAIGAAVGLLGGAVTGGLWLFNKNKNINDNKPTTNKPVPTNVIKTVNVSKQQNGLNTQLINTVAGSSLGVGIVLGASAVVSAIGGVITAPILIPTLLIGAGIGAVLGSMLHKPLKSNVDVYKQPSTKVNTDLKKTKLKSKYKNSWENESPDFIKPKQNNLSSAQYSSIISKGKVDTNKFDLLNFLTGASAANANELEVQALRTQIKREDISKSNLTISERSEEILFQTRVNKVSKKSDWLSNIGDFVINGLNWFNQKTFELNRYFKDRAQTLIRKAKEAVNAVSSSVNNIDYSGLTNIPGYNYMPGLKTIVNNSITSSTDLTPINSVSGKSEVLSNGIKRGGNDLTAAQIAKLTPLGKYLYKYRNNKYVLALSDVVARAEGTDFRSNSKNFGYDMIIGNKNVGLDMINRGHPFVEGGIPRVRFGKGKGDFSSAAGRVQFMDFNYKSKPDDPSDLVRLLDNGDGTPGSFSPAVQDLGTLGGFYKRLGKAGFEKLLAGQDVENILSKGLLSQEYSSLQSGDGTRSSYGQGTPEGQVKSTIPFLRERIKARSKRNVSDTIETVSNRIGNTIVNVSKTTNAIGNKIKDTFNDFKDNVNNVKESVTNNIKQGLNTVKGLFTGESNKSPTYVTRSRAGKLVIVNTNQQVTPTLNSPSITASQAISINAEAIAKQYGLQSLNIVDVQGNAIADYNKKKPPKHPASTIKLVVADLAMGLIDPNKTYVVAQDSVAIGEDKYFAGTKLTGAQLIRNSLRDSDNTSNNTLISIMGGETRVTELARKKGYSSVNVAKLSIPNATQFKNIASNEDVTNAMVSILNNKTILGKVAQESLSAQDRYQPFNVDSQVASKIGNNSKVIGNTSLVDIGGRKYIITAFIDHTKYRTNYADTPQSRRDIRDAQNTVVKLLSSQSSTQSLPALNQAKPSSTYMGSMFPGVSLDKLANYQPKAFQGMNATRKRSTGVELHNKIDFDERVGGGNNAPVISMTGGLATWGKFTKEADSGFVKVKTKDDKGRDVEIVYGHLSLNSISKAFGGKNNIQIQQGQSLGNVRLERYAAAFGAHVDLNYKINGKQVDVQQEMRRLLSNGNASSVAPVSSNSSEMDKEALAYYNKVKSGEFDYDPKSLLNKANSLSIFKISKDKKVTPLLSLTDPALPSVVSNKTTVNINGETYIISTKGKDAQTILDTTSRSIDMLTGNTAISIAQTANTNGQITINRQVISSDKLPAQSFNNVKSVDVNVLPFKQLLDNNSQPNAGYLQDNGTKPDFTIGSTSADNTKNFYRSHGLDNVTSGIGMRVHPVTGVRKAHHGVDLGLPPGAYFKNPFLLGQVVFSNNINPTGYGNQVLIAELDAKTKLPTGRAVMAAHLRNNSLTQKPGSIISGGTIVGTQGNTGVGTGEHLHVEEYKNFNSNEIQQVLKNPASVFSVMNNTRVVPTVETLKAIGTGSILTTKTNTVASQATMPGFKVGADGDAEIDFTNSNKVNLSKYNRNSYILVTRTGKKTDKGEELLSVQNIQNGKVVSSVSAISGIGTARTDTGNTQIFRLANQSKEGSAEPTPEGTYRIKNSVYSSNPGIKGDFFEYIPTGNTRTDRTALGFHNDADRNTKPGTVGCIGFMSKNDMNTFKEWLGKGASRELIVDWGLGTFKDNAKPPGAKEPLKPVKATHNKHASLPINTQSLDVSVLYKEQNISKEHLMIIAEEANKIKAAAKAKMAKEAAEKPIEMPAVTVAKASKYQPDPLADTSMGQKHSPTYAVDVAYNPNNNKMEIEVTEPGVDMLAQWHQIQGGSVPSKYDLMNGSMG